LKTLQINSTKIEVDIGQQGIALKFLQEADGIVVSIPMNIKSALLD
jgi:hypothetical protein